MIQPFLKNRFNEEKLQKFFEEHIDKCGNYTEYNIKIRSSGIGSYVTMKCVVCGKKADISDYDHW